MKKAQQYLLLSLLPALMLGLLALIAVVVGGYAIAWIFLFGDNPWPSYVDPLLMTVGSAAGLLVFALIARGAFAAGKVRDASQLP